MLMEGFVLHGGSPSTFFQHESSDVHNLVQMLMEGFVLHGGSPPTF